MTRVKISWPANPVEQLVTSYKVWEGFLTPGNPTLVGTTSETSLELDVAPGRYAWSVSAVNLAGESGRSAVVYSPAIPTIPETPTIEIVVP
jgi:hypothetical protein